MSGVVIKTKKRDITVSRAAVKNAVAKAYKTETSNAGGKKAVKKKVAKKAH